MEIKSKQKAAVKTPAKQQSQFVWLGSYLTVAVISVTSYFLFYFNTIPTLQLWCSCVHLPIEMLKFLTLYFFHCIYFNDNWRIFD